MTDKKYNTITQFFLCVFVMLFMWTTIYIVKLINFLFSVSFATGHIHSGEIEIFKGWVHAPANEELVSWRKLEDKFLQQIVTNFQHLHGSNHAIFVQGTYMYISHFFPRHPV